jgi:hypothetical protein
MVINNIFNYILVLLQLFDLSIKINSRYLFFQTLIMIAEFYQMFGDNLSCLNTYIRIVKEIFLIILRK